MLRLLQSSALAAASSLLLGGATALGAVVPRWSQPSPVTVAVPSGGSSTYAASGDVTIGGFDALLVFDVSGSMAFDTGQTAPGGGMQRGDWARDGANAFLDNLPASIRMGLTQFAGPSSQVVAIDELGSFDPLSDHRSLLRTTVNGLPRNGVTGTNIGNAINVAAGILNANPIADSRHIVLLTDGEETAGNARTAAAAAAAAGIDTINTVGLPGADVTLLADVAAAGNGQFVDGTNLDNLIAGFSQILGNAETLDHLDILTPGGGVIGDVQVDTAGNYLVDLPIVLGENLFTARATSSLGNVRTADLLVRGVAVPEPTTAATLAGGAGLLALRRRRAGAAR